MKTDMFTKILLLIIIILLGIIVVRPIVQSETAQATTGNYDYIQSLGGLGQWIFLLDTRDGTIWAYSVDSGKIWKKYQLTDLGRPLVSR